MVSFQLAGGLPEVNHVLRTVKTFALAESLGGVESLIDHPVSMTHASMDPVLREEAGITENLIRLSVGLEHIDDLLDDLGKALDTIPKIKTSVLDDERETCETGARIGRRLCPDSAP
jgi:cystathionine gamma-synthase